MADAAGKGSRKMTIRALSIRSLFSGGVVLVFSYSINASKIISLCSTQCEKKRNRRRQRRLIGITIPGRLIELMPAVPVLFCRVQRFSFTFGFSVN